MRFDEQGQAVAVCEYPASAAWVSFSSGDKLLTAFGDVINLSDGRVERRFQF